MDKSSYNALVRRAGKLRDAGELEDGLALLTNLTREAPHWSAAFLVLGDVLWDAGQLEDACAAFDNATRLHPKLEIASKGKFHTLWEACRYEEALKEIRRFQGESFTRDYEAIERELGDRPEQPMG